ncbi:coproporphyrinogen III oxidase [Pontiella sulfatireligans]|uniref:coproporphyrinogen oxidase n=1 Tax=Pontiella sulfatireligans TaxID=2750658 RepID=A0A6C2UG64_9BACT|nr:coproporphyrinogen III oxidase [Pontiella sulfatireligans]VGO18411.1 Oxygen-dependent coproporphyrinogen-III oxidase [Pontiella sulfatireligans]
MTRTFAHSTHATKALQLVESLQSRFVKSLEELGGEAFNSSEWLRNEGRHGGGWRFGAEDTALLGRASVNVSQVHYDDDPERKLGSATAISTIVHPSHPLAPSVHIHISWTEMKGGAGYWRIMADLNPALPNPLHTERFIDALREAAPERFGEATEQGDRYFFIPALNRHRGAALFYLENYSTGDFEADRAFAQRVGEAAVDTYVQLLKKASKDAAPASEAEQAAQLAYHTLYFFQVLTLDRGTTTGLLVHDQNDVGILGSLPPRIDKNLLASWRSRMPEPQDRLLDALLAALPSQGTCVIDGDTKQKLAVAVRAHYQKHPEALEMQASSGNSTPPTIDNHQ